MRGGSLQPCSFLTSPLSSTHTSSNSRSCYISRMNGKHLWLGVPLLRLYSGLLPGLIRSYIGKRCDICSDNLPFSSSPGLPVMDFDDVHASRRPGGRRLNCKYKMRGFHILQEILLDDKKGMSGSRYQLRLGRDVPTCACKSDLHFFSIQLQTSSDDNNKQFFWYLLCQKLCGFDDLYGLLI